MDWAETILAGVCVVCMTLLGIDLYKSAREKLKTMRKRDKYVWAAIFNLTWYCIVSLVLTANDKIVPDSLTVAWFAAWTAELALLANIKIKGKDDWNETAIQRQGLRHPKVAVPHRAARALRALQRAGGRVGLALRAGGGDHHQRRGDRKSTRLNSSHRCTSRMPSSA